MHINAAAVSILALASQVFLAGCAARVDFPERSSRRHASPRAPVSPEADARLPAAELIGKTVTIGELDRDIADQLAAARATYEMALYEARRAALDARIQGEVLQAEASRRGLSVEALLDVEVEGRVTPATDAEVRAFYDEYQDQMDGASFEMMAERIRGHLAGQKRGERRQSLLAELRKRHGVRVLLEPPRVEVEVKGPSRGPDDARVTILIYSDFECPFCARAEPTLERIRQTWPRDVRFVFRHYPLSFHPAARPAAAAASCAHEQERFWPLHDHLFETGELAIDAIRAFLGRQPGFDVTGWDACMADGRGDRVVEEDLAAAGRAQVDGTPHFFINGVRVSGAQPFEAFEAIISAELDR